MKWIGSVCNWRLLLEGIGLPIVMDGENRNPCEATPYGIPMMRGAFLSGPLPKPPLGDGAPHRKE